MYNICGRVSNFLIDIVFIKHLINYVPLPPTNFYRPGLFGNAASYSQICSKQTIKFIKNYIAVPVLIDKNGITQSHLKEWHFIIAPTRIPFDHQSRLYLKGQINICFVILGGVGNKLTAII